MRIATTTLIAALTGISAEGAEDARTTAQRNVTVCLVTDSNQGIFPARTQAAKMLAAIGVTLNWRRGTQGCPAEANGTADLRPTFAQRLSSFKMLSGETGDARLLAAQLQLRFQQV
jgi:hypothetical protein